MNDVGEFDRNICCAFTGHREVDRSLDVNEIYNKVYDLIEQGYRHFYNGGAYGFDLISAEVILDLKEEYPDLKLHLCIPYINQSKNYTSRERRTYERVLQKADYVHGGANRFYKGCLFVRDRYMVDCCSAVIAYLRNSYGGTYFTVKYANEKGVPVYYV